MFRGSAKNSPFHPNLDLLVCLRDDCVSLTASSQFPACWRIFQRSVISRAENSKRSTDFSCGAQPWLENSWILSHRFRKLLPECAVFEKGRSGTERFLGSSPIVSENHVYFPSLTPLRPLSIDPFTLSRYVYRIISLYTP